MNCKLRRQYVFERRFLMLYENIKIIRSNRKTIAIEINSKGIVVRAPFKMKDIEITAFLEKKKSWIDKHLQRVMEHNEALKDVEPYSIEEIHALADKALQIIPEKVKKYAPLIGVDYGRITIRNQRSRWGSCSSAGNLNFNCLLMELPDEVIDSVVVHELCHRKHMNHSPKFYAEIEKVFPKYKQCQQWLKENGSMVLNRLP